MIRLDIMDGVDGGCAVGGGLGFVGIPPYLARQAQVPREFRTSRNPVRFVGENEFPLPIVYGPEGE